MHDWGSHGVPLRRFDEVAGIARYFLLSHGVSRHSHRPVRTITDENAAGSTSEIAMTFFPVARRPGQTLPFVCIGRIDGNDVALPDETVSKFHAFIRETADGMELLDAKSRNGTFVDGVAAAQRGAASGTPLRVGGTVRFGSVTTTFFDRETAAEFVRMFDSKKS